MLALAGSPAATRRRCSSARVQIAFLPQSHPQVHVGGQAVRLQRQRLLKHRDGSGKVPALGQRGSQIRVGPPVFRIEGDRLSELWIAPGRSDFSARRDTQPVVGLRRLGATFTARWKASSARG